MKISASIYSDKKRSLREVIQDLENHQVDLLHVDCNDDPRVFDDIAQIRKWCSIPIDLHLITSTPEKYFDLLVRNPVDYLTFQLEDLKGKLDIPKEISGKKGIAITTPTAIEIFEDFSDFHFILIMATVPGQSGGAFDKINFDKIRRFRKKYPTKSIHVDGGVNGEVSFILRNMGVSCSVSGSYLFNAPSVGHALFSLQGKEIASHYQVGDFMTPIDECPVVYHEEQNLRQVLEVIDSGNLGFCLVIETSGKLAGLISSADIRKALIRSLDNLPNLNASMMLNPNPLTINDSNSVIDMLRLIKASSFPVMYMPVVNSLGHAVGIVNFANLIKAEI
jgi:pentose-5-phosphate-3-epimerase/CBS domain-containing protein